MMASRPKQAEARPAPRLYLITPQVAEANGFAGQLADALAAADVAAVLLRLAAADERTLINRVKELAPLVQDKDAALLLDGLLSLVARAGADGAHVSDIADLGAALELLKPDRIVGAGSLVTRHDAMLAAEAGVDYVMFGGPAAGQPSEFSAIADRIAWWSEVFELPCIGYAATREEIAPLVAAGADFVALDYVWADPRGVAAALADAAERLQRAEIAP
jgi:thiamine-phosphate pyrophosphorylase